MGSSDNAIFNLSRAFRRYGLLNESHKFSRIFSINYSSEDVLGEEDAGKTRKPGDEAVRDVGDRAHEMTGKDKEGMQNTMERTGRKMEEMNGKDSMGKHKEPAIGDAIDDEDQLKKKVAKEPGGKPVDEDKGVDVNWSPIVENKPSSQSSS